MNNSVKMYVEEFVNQKVYSYMFNTFDREALTSIDIVDLIYINKNEKGEIISIDYIFNEGYKYLNFNMKRLYDVVKDIDLSDAYIKGKNGVFFVPGFLSSNNIFLNNFGMKIPVKVNLFSNIDMGFKTKVKEYGINNVLVELYLVINIQNNIISLGQKDSFNNEFEIIVASRLITGKIPDYYGGVIEKSSSIVSS